jgi:hypothetical protein
MKRDLTLYKMCDLYLLLHEYNENDFNKLINHAAKSGLTAECFYSLYITRELFNIKHTITNKVISGFINNTQGDDKHNPPGIINKVINPADKQEYYYEDNNIQKRFFTKNRTKTLTKKEDLYDGIRIKAPILYEENQTKTSTKNERTPKK